MKGIIMENAVLHGKNGLFHGKKKIAAYIDEQIVIQHVFVWLKSLVSKPTRARIMRLASALQITPTLNIF
jgi:hypothetical protein